MSDSQLSGPDSAYGHHVDENRAIAIEDTEDEIQARSTEDNEKHERDSNSNLGETCDEDVPNIDQIGEYLYHQTDGNLAVVTDDNIKYIVNRDKFWNLSGWFRKLSKRAYPPKERYNKIINFRGELSCVIQAVILFAYFGTTSTPSRFAAQKRSCIDARIPGATVIPVIAFAFELWEFSQRYEIRSLAKHALSVFIFTLQTSDRIHPILLNHFLRIGMDFDVHPSVRLEPFVTSVLDTLVRQFGLDIKRGKKPMKAFRDVFAHVTPEHDRILARLLEDEGYSFIIARRCSSCFIGAEHPAIECVHCGSDLGMVGYEDEASMEKWHWNVPARLRPGHGLLCWCDDEGDGCMIRCDGSRCYTKWFHLKCCGMDKAPSGEWLCGDCERDKQTVTTGEPRASKEYAIMLD